MKKILERLIVVMAFYTYEPWTSNVMCGEEGYTGNFRLNK